GSDAGPATAGRRGAAPSAVLGPASAASDNNSATTLLRISSDQSKWETTPEEDGKRGDRGRRRPRAANLARAVAAHCAFGTGPPSRSLGLGVGHHGRPRDGRGDAARLARRTVVVPAAQHPHALHLRAGLADRAVRGAGAAVAPRRGVA